MKSFNAINLFQKQIERNILSKDFKTKVIVTPSSINEKGLTIQLSVYKTTPVMQPRGTTGMRNVLMSLVVKGSAESSKGLEMALEAIERLDNYLVTTGPINLEDETGNPIPNAKIYCELQAESSFIDSPDSIEVQTVEDRRMITIKIPTN